MVENQNFGSGVGGNPEDLVEREYYYVVLLIDSSQSMLWPFLKDQRNKHEFDSDDYKTAVKKVQASITEAHAKALDALRKSSICKAGYLKVYQYTFNSAKRLINEPELLNRFGRDKVVKLNSDNYMPESITALYDVIYEALDVVYTDYLKPEVEKHSRPDKVIIGVITDGEETSLDPAERAQRIQEIKGLLKELRGTDTYSHLFSSVLIGLTSQDYSKRKLQEEKEKLSFDDHISIDQSDDKAIRNAFRLWSSEASDL